MEPTIQGTNFGSITVAGEVYDHDIVIRLLGQNLTPLRTAKPPSQHSRRTSATVSTGGGPGCWDF
jgi:hypothetical protein